jgi:hypothetical protein
MRYGPLILLLSLSLTGCADAQESPVDNGATAAGPNGLAPSGESATRCESIKASIAAGGFGDTVTVTCDDTYAWLTSTTYPDHELMTGITGSNEQTAVPAVGFSAPIPLAPSGLDGVNTRDNALGIAINGVPIYDYTSAGELDPAGAYDAGKDTVVTGQLDICGGHAGRGDDYHYHKAPNCMMDAMGEAADTAILGWGYDGYPLYGFMNPDGTELADGDLDLCNGMADATFGYRYHASAEPPYIFQCLRGDIDEGILPRVAPLKATAGTPKKPDGQPPQGGVDDLVFSEDADGKRTMTYSYKGANYFIGYEPSGTADCYIFTMNTVTSGEVTGEYCRE